MIEDRSKLIESVVSENEKCQSGDKLATPFGVVSKALMPVLATYLTTIMSLFMFFKDEARPNDMLLFGILTLGGFLGFYLSSLLISFDIQGFFFWNVFSVVFGIFLGALASIENGFLAPPILLCLTIVLATNVVYLIPNAMKRDSLNYFFTLFLTVAFSYISIAVMELFGLDRSFFLEIHKLMMALAVLIFIIAPFLTLEVYWELEEAFEHPIEKEYEWFCSRKLLSATILNLLLVVILIGMFISPGSSSTPMERKKIAESLKIKKGGYVNEK